MSDPGKQKQRHVLSDELLQDLVARLKQLQKMSSDPAKVEENIKHVNMPLRLRS